MSTDLAKIARVRIQPGVAWSQPIATCTNAVVCWLWCLTHDAFQAGTAMSGANRNVLRDDGIAYRNRAAAEVPPGHFLNFINPPGKQLRRTDLFLYNMATQKGSIRWAHSIKILYQGMLVLWVDRTRDGRVAHAGVNGGNNTIYGYNQGGAYYKPQCGPHVAPPFPRPYHEHPQHHWCPRKASHMNWEGYKIYTVSAADAMTFFNRYHDHLAMW
jgi:hypothetical protein